MSSSRKTYSPARMRAIRYSVLMFCRGANSTTSNAAHRPEASTPAVASAIIRCASSRRMPAFATMAVICGPAVRAAGGTTEILGLCAIADLLPFAADPVHVIFGGRCVAAGRSAVEHPQQQPPVRAELGEEPVGH